MHSKDREEPSTDLVDKGAKIKDERGRERDMGINEKVFVIDCFKSGNVIPWQLKMVCILLYQQ